MIRKKTLLIVFFLSLFIFQQTQVSAKFFPGMGNLSSNPYPMNTGLPTTVLVYMYEFDPITGDPTFNLCDDDSAKLGCVETGSNFTYPPDSPYVTFPYGGVNPISVDIENYYLKNVLPREMNVAENYPTLAALQAQTLAARSIADWKTRAFGAINFDNTTRMQVFVPGSYEKYKNPNDPDAALQIQGWIYDAITSTNGQYLSYNGNGESIDAEFGSDMFGNTNDEPAQDYLESIEDPISESCDAGNNSFGGYGMSQKGAIRWSKGDQCAGTGSQPWPVRWTDYRQILVHYYTGIDILNGSGGKVAPDDRWNLLWHDAPVGAEANPNNPIGFQVQLQNTSTSGWGENDVILGYQWTPKNAQAIPGNWTDAVYIPAAGKGEDKTFTASNIMSPSNGGEYTLHLDLRHQNGSWFSNAGWPDAAININITGATATPTTTSTLIAAASFTPTVISIPSYTPTATITPTPAEGEWVRLGTWDNIG